MIELKGNYNIFELPKQPLSSAVTEAMCVTTNGIVKQNGEAVMGAGIAKQVNDYFHVANLLGKYINEYGNRAFNLGVYSRQYLNDVVYFRLFTLPTKHHFRLDSDINLIVKSCEQLVEMCTKFNINKCYLTPPGCGCGNLDYESIVKPWISQILDDRFIVVLSLRD